jgi:radical SAM superfamily enzyme YgiQ (UPF0313 family)
MKKKEKGVLFISPRKIKESDINFGVPHLISLGGYLQQELNIRVEVLDLNYENNDIDVIVKKIISLGPFHCIGISCYSSFDYLNVKRLGAVIKSCFPDVPLIAGGYHVSALPEDCINGDNPFDAVITGEGELACKEIITDILDNKKIEQKIYRPRVIAQLDSLPSYRWDLLKRYLFVPKYIGTTVQIYMSRGCPYHCNFCMEQSKESRGWRAFSADRAVEELKRLGSFIKLKNAVINIADPLFGYSASWRRGFLAQIIKSGLRPHLFWALMRVENLSEEDIYLLSEAGFAVGFGLESGDETMLARMNKATKPEVFLSNILRFEKYSRKYGLHWAANLIIGYPGETNSSMMKTYDFARRLFTSNDNTFGWLSVDPFRLYPGSPVYYTMETLKSMGTIFYRPSWWKEELNQPFYAEYIDPSHDITYRQRVEFMYSMYGPLLESIRNRFILREKDPLDVYAKSISTQVHLLQKGIRDRLLSLSEKEKTATKP